MSDTRPDPDALLRRIREEARGERQRGRLRIYLGAFPGVGKTYSMLNEAHRRKTYGEDVVVGLVETHGRANTATMLEGLEVIPRKVVDYQGHRIEEMDVDAILRRHPAVCLVDEIAHTNAPGSERQKRYEDVAEIRYAGIDVVATLNVQHLESLNDTVESITGVRVRETIPDSVLDEADEVILIDLSPEGARARMQHGHIYPPDQARVALERFFRPENLAALRELALRRTAQEVDERLEDMMHEVPRPPQEKLLALIDEKQESRALIREAWRLAEALNAELVVGYSDARLPETARLDLAKTLELAEDLNGRIVHMADAAPDTVAATVRSEGIRHVVVRAGKARLMRPASHDAIARSLQQSGLDTRLHVVLS
jgi:two-component system sensor histidine kinase KdpD